MLTAVDVVCRTRQRGVAHDVNGKCGDIDRADDTPDRQGRPQLFATPVKVFAEQGRREWRIDEAGGDQVDADGCKLERQIGDEGGKSDRHCCDNRQAWPRATRASAAHEYQRSGRPDLAGGAAGDVDREQQVLGEIMPRLIGRKFER